MQPVVITRRNHLTSTPPKTDKLRYPVLGLYNTRTMFIGGDTNTAIDSKYCPDFKLKQDNVQVNTESVQCISRAYSEVRVTEISEQLSRVDH